MAFMRCFLAIDIPDELRTALAELQDRLRGRVDGVRWVHPEQIHLTVKFLGDVESNDIQEVSIHADRIAGRIAPFDLAFAGTGCFPSGGAVRIIWVGLPTPPAGLADAQQTCERQYAELGFPSEQRAYHPHLTLGRVKDTRNAVRLRSAIRAEDGFRAMPFLAEELILFESVPGKQGPRYLPINRSAFGANLGGG